MVCRLEDLLSSRGVIMGDASVTYPETGDGGGLLFPAVMFSGKNRGKVVLIRPLYVMFHLNAY